MSEWQPIETAPKDGTPVLIYSAGWGKCYKSPIAVDFWHTRDYGFSFDGWYHISNPTHWIAAAGAAQMNRGDTVNIVDQRLDGTYYYEGQAKLLWPVDASRNRWRVKFVKSDRFVMRVIYPGAQNGLLSFIKKMNDAEAGNDQQQAVC